MFHFLQSLLSTISLKTRFSWLLQHRNLWLNFPNKFKSHESHWMAAHKTPYHVPFHCSVCHLTQTWGSTELFMNIRLKLSPLHVCLLKHKILLQTSVFCVFFFLPVMRGSKNRFKIKLSHQYLERLDWYNDSKWLFTFTHRALILIKFYKYNNNNNNKRLHS